MLNWLLAVTESGKKSHLTETDAYTFCAPFWGKVEDSIPYEGQTSFRGKPLCKNCDKWGAAKAGREIARQHGDESPLWTQYQIANGVLKVSGRSRLPAADPDPDAQKKRKRKLPENMREFPASASA